MTFYAGGATMRGTFFAGWVMGVTMATTLCDATETEPTGAASAWTTSDAVVVRARELVARGKFQEAERALKDATNGDRRAQGEMLDIIRWTRWEYGLDEAGLIEKVRKSIPDLTADDVARWREDGELQHREIDGQVWYFRREPSNLFRFGDEAKRRRDAHATAKATGTSSAIVLEKHLAEVIDAAEKAGRADVEPVRHRVDYTVTVQQNHPLVKPGATVRCWLPFPQEHE